MPILKTPNGLEILRFVLSDTPDVPADDQQVPLTWAIIVARYKAGYVFAYNYNRKQWELPGGKLERGETAAEAIQRELREESCQIANWVVCKGVFKIRLELDRGGKLEYGALYYTELDELHPFKPNNETNALTISDPSHDTEGVTSSWSRWFIHMAASD
jgi:8-oxo-dGTP diphosphatase